MDKIPEGRRSTNMRHIRSRDTEPEVRLRRLLYHAGYRYRANVTDLPGRPDIVFKGRRKVIFLHGCFWHQHEDPRCGLVHLPHSRQDYWLTKLARTKDRDTQNLHALQKAGWAVLVVWECELEDLESLWLRLSSFLEQ